MSEKPVISLNITLDLPEALVDLLVAWLVKQAVDDEDANNQLAVAAKKARDRASRKQT